MSDHRLFPLWRILVCLLLSAASCASADTVKLAAGFAPTHLYDHLEYMEDATQAMTLEQVRRLPDNRFETLTLQNFKKGFTSSAFWLRIKLVNFDRAPLEWAMQHRLAFTDFVEYWVVVDNRVVDYAIGGDRTVLAERQVPYRYPAVRHLSQPGENAELYIRLRNSHQAHVHLVFELSSGAQFTQMMASDQLRLGALYGMPLTLALMALIGWAVTRDRRFSLYALYAFSILGSWLGLNGQLGEYVFINMPALANDALQVFFLFSIIFSAMFSRAFLNTRELLPKTDLYFRVLIWASAACILLRAAGVYTLVTKLSILMLMLDAAAPVIGWIALRRGISYARWYVIAQLFYSTMLAALVALGLLKLNLLFSYDMFIVAECAFIGQLLFLSLALYDRMHALGQDKANSERRYQQMLEVQVAERTRDLAEAKEKADHANRSKSEFLANMSHEIRTPINAIAGFTTLALRTNVSPQQAGYLEKIHAAAQGLLRIINDLLDFSKIEAGHLEMERIRFGLNEVIDTTLAYIRPLADEKGLMLLVQVEPGMPAHFMGDPLRLGQILVNLCSNAVKFTERGEVEVRAGLASRSGDVVRLLFSVRDTGMGLTPAQSAKLFQAFTQADTSTTRKFGGTGLGLVICRRLVGMMNGRIWLESEKGVGTTFFFEVEFDTAQVEPDARCSTFNEGMPPALPASSAPSILQSVPDDMQGLLTRFANALSAVNAGLATLDRQTPGIAASVSWQAPELLEQLQPPMQELIQCLKDNDTRAEQIVASLEEQLRGRTPSWMIELAQSVDALEYESGLTLLHDAGWSDDGTWHDQKRLANKFGQH